MKKIYHNNSIKGESFWRVCSKEEYDYLMKNKELVADEGKVRRNWFGYDNFIWAYKWMNRICKELISGYSVDSPVWLFKDRPLANDFKNWGRRKEFYLVETVLDTNTYIESCFEAWHFVLYGNYFGEELESKKYDNFNAWDAWDEERSYNKEEKEIEESWNKIFNIKDLKEKGFSKTIQVCTDKIILRNIKSIRQYRY